VIVRAICNNIGIVKGQYYSAVERCDHSGMIDVEIEEGWIKQDPKNFTLETYEFEDPMTLYDPEPKKKVAMEQCDINNVLIDLLEDLCDYHQDDFHVRAKLAKLRMYIK